MVAAADGERGAARVAPVAQLLAATQQVGFDAALLAILPAADQHDVAAGVVPRIAQIDAANLGGNSARLAAFDQRPRIAPIAVQIEQIRVEHIHHDFRLAAHADSHNSVAPGIRPNRPRTSMSAV